MQKYVSLTLLLMLFTCLHQVASSQELSDSLLRTLRAGHPRLLATATDFEKLKEDIARNPTLQKWQKNIQQQADKMVAEPVSRYEIPDGLRLLTVSRRVVDRVYTLGLIYQLSKDTRYASRMWQELEAASRFPDWNPKHFLDTGEMTHAFAIGYDWLYDYWTKEQKHLIKQAIIEKGLSRAMLAYEGKATSATSWWVKAQHNWNQVCNGGIGMGALAIAEEEPQLAEYILKNVVRLLPNAMKHFAPDGAWDEGPGYWAYTTQYNVAILAALETALGTDFGLSAIEGFSRTALFPIYLTGPLGRTFNYADGKDGTIRGPQLFWLAGKFNLPSVATFQQQWASPKALDMLWYPADVLKQTLADLPLDAYFRHAEVATMRSAWHDSTALFVGLKAGDNQANHSNLDAGSFVLDALGHRWAVDLGAENYNLPKYFESKPGGTRWTYYRMRAESHNTLVLNPGPTADQNEAAKTKIIRFESAPDKAFALMDLTPAYDKHAQSLRRGIAMLNRSRIIVQDELQAEKPAELYWFLHTPARIQLSNKGKMAILTIGTSQLQANILAPATAAFSVLPARPLPTSPQPQGIDKNEGISRLTIHLYNVKKERIVVELMPVAAKAATDNMRMPATLDEW